MKTENQINSDIMNIILKIDDSFPELAKYFEEMPPVMPTVEVQQPTIDELEHYTDSLNSLFIEYAKVHSDKEQSIEN